MEHLAATPEDKVDRVLEYPPPCRLDNNAINDDEGVTDEVTTRHLDGRGGVLSSSAVILLPKLMVNEDLLFRPTASTAPIVELWVG
jgi:hypothetical protein